MPVCLKCCFKCLGRRVRPFDSGAVFPDYHTGSGLVRLKLKVHKYALCSLEKSFVVRVVVLVRFKGFVLPAIVSANPHWRGVGWLEFEKFSLLDLLNCCYLHFENVLIGLWNSSGAVRPHRVKKVVCPPIAFGCSGAGIVCVLHLHLVLSCAAFLAIG